MNIVFLPYRQFHEQTRSHPQALLILVKLSENHEKIFLWMQQICIYLLEGKINAVNASTLRLKVDVSVPEKCRA